MRELAAMTVALTDGLAVQVLAEPGSVDVRSVLAHVADVHGERSRFGRGRCDAGAGPDSGRADARAYASIPMAARVSLLGAPVLASQPMAA